jgi:hypothetical protein
MGKIRLANFVGWQTGRQFLRGLQDLSGQSFAGIDEVKLSQTATSIFDLERPRVKVQLVGICGR